MLVSTALSNDPTENKIGALLGELISLKQKKSGNEYV